MVDRSPLPSLTDMVEAIGHVRAVLTETSVEAFEGDWRLRWLVERGVEIISEASRRLPDTLKARHPDIPWRKVAGVGNVLRHEYANIAPEVLWALAYRDLPQLENVCQMELAAALRLRDGGQLKG